MLQSQSIVHGAERCSAVALKTTTGLTHLTANFSTERPASHYRYVDKHTLCIRFSDLSVNTMLSVLSLVVVTAVLNVIAVAMACRWCHVQVGIENTDGQKKMVCSDAHLLLLCSSLWLQA